jgi:hypothetical protein
MANIFFKDTMLAYLTRSQVSTGGKTSLMSSFRTSRTAEQSATQTLFYPLLRGLQELDSLGQLRLRRLARSPR